MSAAKFTPGPWWVTDSGVRDAGGYICHFNSVTRYPGQDERYESEVAERAANKELIAAVPELLEALQAFMALDRSFTTICDAHLQEIAGKNSMARAVKLARAAIAKATGSA